MKVGIHFANFTLPGGPESMAATLAATARAAEEGGCDTFTLMDHWFQMEQFATAQDPMLEGYTSLGYLAGLTQHHDPRSAGHRGDLSASRAAGQDRDHPRRPVRWPGSAGIGAAWYEREHAALGVPFPPLGERFERLEETLQICQQMWSDDDGPYTGAHYQLAETICSPRPLSRPRPPILVGGSGERKTLRLVARYADACNLFAPDPDVVAHKLEVLARHCDAESRDPDSIERRSSASPIRSPTPPPFSAPWTSTPSSASTWSSSCPPLRIRRRG